jgi:ATP-dependent DNA helicase RecQ
LPAECVLFFNPGDAVKQRRFIEDKSEHEQRIGHEQLRAMVGYAEARDCRRATLLRYFGEGWPTKREMVDGHRPPLQVSCGGCDNCLNPPETFDGTVHAQKFLSCVHRVYAKQGFGFGLNHVVEVLIGGKTEAIEQRGHDQLSTFGIGREITRETWQAIGRELLRLGLVAAAPGKFATLQITEAGLATLRERRSITLTTPLAVAKTKRRKNRAGEIECDEELFERLRIVRRKLADERNVPAYVIFSDVSLREMARLQPTTRSDFGRIAGVGEQKLRDFAEPFTASIKEHLSIRSPR